MFYFQKWETGESVVVQPTSFASDTMTSRFTLCWDAPAENRKMCSVTHHEMLLVEHQNKSCSLILLENLAESKLIFVRCQSQLVENVLCKLQKNNSLEISRHVSNVSKLFCENVCLKRERHCVCFIWQTFRELTTNKKGRKPLPFNETKYILLLFDAVATQSFHPVFQQNVTLHLSRTLDLQSVTYQYNWTASGQAIVMVLSKIRTIETSGNLFLCKVNQFISILFVCNHLCNDEESDNSKKELCSQDKIDKECPKMHFNTPEKTCSRFSFHETKVAMILTESKYCSNCTEKGMLHCHLKGMACYTFEHICIYNLSTDRDLIPCPHGEHMQQCDKFYCNTHFKCPEYYCIPWSYKCDGKWDCPRGLDEVSNDNCRENRSCSNLFKCNGSVFCVHIGDVCDGYNNYPGGDDEQMCVLFEHKCPHLCQCLALAVVCTDNLVLVGSGIFSESQPYFSLEIHNCTLPDNAPLSLTFPNLILTAVTNSGVVEICSVFHLSNNILLLNYSSNLISQVEKNCFSGNQKLSVIWLNNNKISCFQGCLFTFGGATSFGHIKQLFDKFAEDKQSGHLHIEIPVTERK